VLREVVAEATMAAKGRSQPTRKELTEAENLLLRFDFCKEIEKGKSFSDRSN